MKHLKTILALRGVFTKMRVKLYYRGNNIFSILYIVFIKLASNIIGFLVIFIFGFSYITNLWKQSADKVTTTGFAALGIIMALSALSFTMAQFITDEDCKSRVILAGERFFHSCLFLIQAIIFKYASEFDTVFLVRVEIMPSILKTLASLVSGIAFVQCMTAYETIDDLLWNLYTARLFKFDEDRKGES